MSSRILICIGLENKLKLLSYDWKSLNFWTIHFSFSFFNIGYSTHVTVIQECYVDFSNILLPFRHFTYVTTHSPSLPSLYLRHNSFSNSSVASPKSQFILQPFFRFSYVTSSSLNSPGEPPMIETLIIQPLCHFIYVTTHSPSLPSLYLRHNSFSNPSVVLPTSQLILQPFRRFTYVTDHSPSSPLLRLRHSSFSNPSFASPTSQALHFIHLASRPWNELIFTQLLCL